ncbi:MAG TPA: helix-turn-helix domain-containing protein [Burkholderiaceae bacterium]|nr:helix-turn-helix domain-containing protein [Burkholderiaceae bacterium]
MDTVKTLQQLGFTEYEARAYTALVNEGELNGYELAKKTGIPRANIYAVAEKLVERGAILRADHQSGQRYTPIPPEQLLLGLEVEHKRALVAAAHALAHQANKQEPAAVFNLRGDELLAKARQIVDTCQDSLLVGIQAPEAVALAAALRTAADRGVHITTLCLQACEHECGGCQGDIHRHAIAPRGDRHWLMLVADRHTALVGQTGEGTAEGMTTSQQLVVELAMAFIRQNLALATLGGELGGRIGDLLPPPTLGLLNDLYPDGGFPAYFQNLGAKTLS